MASVSDGPATNTDVGDRLATLEADLDALASQALSAIQRVNDLEVELWRNMPPEILTAERELREERGEPLPPILEARI